MSQLRNVEQVRDRLVRGMHRELSSLRVYLSATDNPDAVVRLYGQEGDTVLARVVDFMLSELGHTTPVKADDPASQTRRRARGSMGNA